MPKSVFGRDHAFLPREQLLSFEEIDRLARAFVRAGVTKIRLTGGEPLLRRDIEELVSMLSPIDGLDLTLTTNAALLARRAQALRDAGLGRLNVSLDSLDDDTFRRMNDVDFPVDRVLEGIEAATAVGFTPIKVNMVVKRGVNDAGVVAMAERFRGSGHIVRFIEYMDVGMTNGWATRRSRAGGRDRRADRRRPRARADRRRIPRRGREALALQGRRRRDRRHLLGDAALLRRLPRVRGSQPTGAYTHAFSPAAATISAPS